MESELQKERAQIASLRRTAEDERGGLKADMDVEKGLFSDYGHSMHSRAPVEPRGGSNTFAAGAEAERERELVGKVRRDLSEMESFMGDDAEQEVSKRPHTVVVRSRAIGHSGSVLPEIIREGLEEDVKDMGDTKVPVAGHPINLDII